MTLATPDVDTARDLLEQLTPPCEAKRRVSVFGPHIRPCPEHADWIVHIECDHSPGSSCPRGDLHTLSLLLCTDHLEHAKQLIDRLGPVMRIVSVERI